MTGNRLLLCAVLVAAFALPCLAEDPPEAKSPVRFSRLLAPAVKDGVLTKAVAEKLEEEWSALKVSEVPRDQGFEEGLIQISRTRNWISTVEADALVARLAVKPTEPEGEGVSWLSKILSVLPWIGGIALAVGALAVLVTWLSNAGRPLQVLASAAGTALVLWGADRLGAASWPKVAEIFSVAGAVGILGTAALVVDALGIEPPLRFAAFVLACAWGAVACRLDSSLVAGLSAFAAAVLVGSGTAFEFATGGEGRRGSGGFTLGLTGFCVVLLGYGGLIAALKLGLPVKALVRPYWTVGITGLLVSAGVSWDWSDWFSPSRLWALVLGGALVALGVVGSEGVFVGAGGLALVVWTYTTFIDVFARHLPLSWAILFTGLLTLGIAAGFDHWWRGIVALLTAVSF